MRTRFQITQKLVSSLVHAGVASCCFLVVLLAASNSAAIASDAGSFSACEQLISDLADGQLDEWSLDEAFLIAGGVDEPRKVREFQRQLAERISEVAAALPGQGTDYAAEGSQSAELNTPSDTAAEQLFAELHSRLLSGRYIADCTELHRVLEAGDYNCVTATFLYHALCQREGIPCSIICTPAHVFCRLPRSAEAVEISKLPGNVSANPGIEVQTTCASWFRIARDPKLLTIARSQNPCLRHAPELHRELTELQLLGKVFYNRGLAELNRKRYEAAAELFRVGLRLDPDDTAARTNLLATYNEWALDLVDQQQFASAAECLAQGRQLDAEYKPYQVNDLYVHQKWAHWLCEHHEYDQAIEILESGRLRRPDAELFQKGPAAIRRLKEAISHNDSHNDSEES